MLGAVGWRPVIFNIKSSLAFGHFGKVSEAMVVSTIQEINGRA